MHAARRINISPEPFLLDQKVKSIRDTRNSVVSNLRSVQHSWSAELSENEVLLLVRKHGLHIIYPVAFPDDSYHEERIVSL